MGWKVKHNWAEMEPKIFEMLKENKRYADVARKIDVPYTSFMNWFKRTKAKKRYYEYFKSKRTEPRKYIRHKDERDSMTERLPKCNNFKKCCAAFKRSLKTDMRVKNHRTGDSGVVVGIYPNVFTIRVDDGGWLTSFQYIDYREFQKKRKGDYIWIQRFMTF